MDIGVVGISHPLLQHSNEEVPKPFKIKRVGHLV
jgi:hypothetical protein